MSHTPSIPSMDLVIIGSSAGGIDALRILVRTLPLDFPAPIVVAQHLDPSHESSLAPILQGQTPLTVESVATSRLLERGTIYVVPSDKHIIISDGHVAIEDAGPVRPRPSIDRLLSSAATVYGERLFVIILTGRGADGAVGAAAAKQAGGTIIIQNPATARYPSMPLALPPNIVDFKADLEQMGALLYQLITGTGQPQTEAPPEVLDQILAEVAKQTVIDFRSYKKTSLAGDSLPPDEKRNNL